MLLVVGCWMLGCMDACMHCKLLSKYVVWSEGAGYEAPHRKPVYFIFPKPFTYILFCVFFSVFVFVVFFLFNHRSYKKKIHIISCIIGIKKVRKEYK